MAFRLKWSTDGMDRALILEIEPDGTLRPRLEAFRGDDDGYYRKARHLAALACPSLVTGEWLQQSFKEVNCWSLEEMWCRTY